MYHVSDSFLLGVSNPHEQTSERMQAKGAVKGSGVGPYQLKQYSFCRILFNISQKQDGTIKQSYVTSKKETAKC